MDDHVWSLNHVEASALIFDTRFAGDVERHKDELKTVRHFVGIGADCPDWATPFAQLESGGSAADPYLDVDEDAPCFLQLTSGTTGHPKAWVKTYRSWQAVINHNLIHFDTFGPGTPPVGPNDVNLHFHPIQWASGFQTLYPYFVRGARTVLLDDEVFDPGVLLDTIAGEQVTGVFMPGPLLTPVLDEVEARGGFAHRLRRMVVFFGNPDQLDRTTRLLGPIWAHGFGSTEQGAITTRLLPHEVEERRDRIKSVGRSGSPFLEIAVVDEQGSRLAPGQVGEIVVRSAMSLGGYWGCQRTQRAVVLPWRLVPPVRRRLPRRGRLPLLLRPGRGPDHHRKRHRLPAPGRGGDPRPRLGLPVRRHRARRIRPGRGRSRHPAQGGRHALRRARRGDPA